MSAVVTTLGNGLRVVSQAMPGIETAAVALSAGTGARHEGSQESGLAHLFEHMLFKGTARRSARAIAEEIEARGGDLNAWTGRDITVFHARTLAEDLALGLDIIADMVRAPTFDADELEREKQVVLQELGEARDTPSDNVHDHLHAVAFPDQPFGRPILGDDASVLALDRDALVGWLGRYRPQAMVVSAAGRVDHDALVRQAEALLGDLDGDEPDALAAARYQAGEFSDPRRCEQAHVTLGLEAPSLHADDHYAATLFAIAAGGGMSSRLFQTLREEQGLAYSVYAAHAAYADTGLFSIYLATARRDAGRAEALARDVLQGCAETLSEAELARAKAQAKASVLMALESCAAQAESLGRQILVYDRLQPPAEVIARIDGCSLAETRACAQAMLAGRWSRARIGAPRAA